MTNLRVSVRNVRLFALFVLTIIAMLGLGASWPHTVKALTCSNGQFNEKYRNETQAQFGTRSIRLERCTSAINYDWGTGSPANRVQPDNFTLRAVGTFNFPQSGEYRFTTATDDGVRVYVDGVRVVDAWVTKSNYEVSGTRNLSAGTHTVRVEYFEATGLAEANVSWALSAPPPPPDCSSSLQTLINNAAAGSTLALGNCTYRESVTVNKPLMIDGQGQASLRGSDVWNNFSASGGNWVSSQSVPTLHTETRNTCNASSNQRCKLPEQVYLDGAPQRQIATGGDPAAGQFALNGSRQVVLGSDPTGKTVEVTTRQRWLTVGASGVTIKGFDMRHAGNQAQTGALDISDVSNFVAENSAFQYAHGYNVGVGGSRDVRFVDSKFNYAGQMGVGANGSGVSFIGGEFAHNNTEDFDPGWEAGALKITQTPNDAPASPRVLFDGVDVHHNNGPGIWFDINANDVEVRNCRAHDNLYYGIFFEVSDDAEIHHNVVYNNATYRDDGWGYNGQIISMASGHVDIHDNVVAWGLDGISVMNAQRGDAYPTTGIQVHDNTILMNRDVNFSQALAFDGVLYDASMGNLGFDNRYWFSMPESPNPRFQWMNTHLPSLAQFNATPGEERGRYLTDAEKDAVLATHNIPPP